MLKFFLADSPVHRVDARVKLLVLLLLSSLLLLKSSLAASVLLLIALAAVYLISRLPPAQIAGDLKPAALLVAIPVGVYVLFRREELMLGIASSIALLDIFLLAFLFVYTTSLKDISQALLFFKIPKSMVFAMVIALQFIPAMQRRFEEVRVAQAARGHRLAGLLSPIPLLIPMLHFLFRKSRELALSLDSRGFDAEHIHMESGLRMREQDYMLLIFLLAALLLLSMF